MKEEHLVLFQEEVESLDNVKEIDSVIIDRIRGLIN